MGGTCCFPRGDARGEPGTVAVKGGAAMIAIRSGVQMLPVFIGRQKSSFSRVPIIFGKPYDPQYTGRKGTAEEYQANAEEVMRQAYALGGSHEGHSGKERGLLLRGAARGGALEQTARERGGCVMLGSIIHNAHVVQHLEQLGAHQVAGRRKSARATRYSSAPTARKKQVIGHLKDIGAECVDATCPERAARAANRRAGGRRGPRTDHHR